MLRLSFLLNILEIESGPTVCLRSILQLLRYGVKINLDSSREYSEKALKFFPKKKAIICGTHHWTYQEFYNRVTRLACALKSYEI